MPRKFQPLFPEDDLEAAQTNVPSSPLQEEFSLQSNTTMSTAAEQPSKENSKPSEFESQDVRCQNVQKDFNSNKMMTNAERKRLHNRKIAENESVGSQQQSNEKNVISQRETKSFAKGRKFNKKTPMERIQVTKRTVPSRSQNCHESKHGNLSKESPVKECSQQVQIKNKFQENSRENETDQMEVTEDTGKVNQEIEVKQDSTENTCLSITSENNSISSYPDLDLTCDGPEEEVAKKQRTQMTTFSSSEVEEGCPQHEKSTLSNFARVNENISQIEKCKLRYSKVLARMERRKNEVKKRFIMFLPTAFKTPAMHESEVQMLYGNFQVNQVRMNYNEHGDRLGSGTMLVLADQISEVHNWGRDRPWRALRMFPLSKQRLETHGHINIKLFLKKLSNYHERNLKKELMMKYEATRVDLLYYESGSFTRNALVEMSLKNAVLFETEINSTNLGADKGFRVGMLQIYDAYSEISIHDS